MKLIKFFKLYSWFFLLSFILGQLSLYSHQHKVLYPVNKTSKKDSNKNIVVEKCAYCQAMHFGSGEIPNPGQFKTIESFIRVSFREPYSNEQEPLVLSSGRSPPKA